ncbi:MAG: crosslink repair DNA glycosylase YcaQ family protein [Planctomycetota bacterium]
MATIERLGLSEFKRRVVAGSFPHFVDLHDALQEMQFVQADPIRSPARAQDLTLRQRVAGYVAGDLEKQFQDLNAEEGYLFAYGFMTPEVWRGLRWRPRGKLKKLERAVLSAVAELGDVHSGGLDERFGRKSVENYWGGKSKETKQVLENLHHHGYLRVSRREKGIRVYQVPEESGEQAADPLQRFCVLVSATARVFGPTTKRFLLSELRTHNHLLPSRADRLTAIDSMVEAGELAEVEVAGVTCLWRREQWLSDDVHARVRILAPFDPLVRDRDRFAQLWDWTYRFEAYVPAAKRERGYYAMPVLWRDNVIGWANANVMDGRLQVEFGYVLKRPRAKLFRLQAEAEVEAMTTFLGLENGAWELAL